jgi:hypothetical protein
MRSSGRAAVLGYMLSLLFFCSFLFLPIAVGDSWRVTLLLWD